jgi:hypothetical protein
MDQSSSANMTTEISHEDVEARVRELVAAFTQTNGGVAATRVVTELESDSVSEVRRALRILLQTGKVRLGQRSKLVAN